METIAVIFGGRSAEHDVSIITALSSIIKPLELTKKYRIEPIYIAKDGAWYSDPKLKNIELFTTNNISDFIRRLTPISVQFDGGMKIIKASGIAGRKQHIKIDLVFPAMHGTYGEDGALTGLLDMANIPYVGCGVAASAVSMDKLLAKRLARDNGIEITNFVAVNKTELETQPSKVLTKIEANLSYPLFIKPTHLGSSIGISRVTNLKELKTGLEVAAHYDHDIIVEEEVANLTEVTLPIIGNDEPILALLEQPQTKADDFFDFDTKYLQGGKKGKSGSKGAQGYSKIPADLDKDLYKRAEETGLAIYKCFGLSGIARVDMLIDTKASKVYFNEVNPLPGGLYSHNWNKAGLSNIELVQKLVDLAKQRYTERQSLNTTFNTNYLRQF